MEIRFTNSAVAELKDFITEFLKWRNGERVLFPAVSDTQALALADALRLLEQ